MMHKKNKNLKVLCLLSGGLDSRLACKIMQEQCDVEAVFFDLPFGTGCCNFECSFNFSQIGGIKLHLVDCKKGELFEEYMNIIRKPKHGRGSAANPCIDCHEFMLKKAKELAQKINASALVTGEVLDERPMSQRKKALDIIEKGAGVEGMLIRPLSAKLLPPTILEKEGIINREKFFDIKGRQRNKQMELAQKYGIKYPTPGGGCALCEKGYARKLNDLLKNNPLITIQDIEILRIGRHFKIDGLKVIVGRREAENNLLEKFSTKADIILEASDDIPSPTTLIISNSNDIKKETIIKAAEITAYYSDPVKESEDVPIDIRMNCILKGNIKSKRISDEELKSLRLT
ncbi:MAG: tRNA 4-thiouridine(8) synthase ThiI [archaeon]